ncbi:MAG TPA: hypothetical protein VFH56_10945 [Acidimicrobiales bacterium]|nr:hypothetical protein [Acidimicrobiales bacterium]
MFVEQTAEREIAERALTLERDIMRTAGTVEDLLSQVVREQANLAKMVRVRDEYAELLFGGRLT